MAGKYFTKEDIRKMATEKVKGYLDQGWYFNFNYMSCSNGYEFAAVTDGKDTIVVYIKFRDRGFSSKVSELMVEKFTGYNNEYENIWLDNGKGEMLENHKFLFKPKTETFAMVDDYDEVEAKKKNSKRWVVNCDDTDIDVSKKMYPAIVNFVKKQGIPGLKRIKASDVVYSYYRAGMNTYYVKIKDKFMKIDRDTWEVKVF